MTEDSFALKKEQDRLRERFLKYTRRAFRCIPPITNPQILDVGCGSGLPTITLAQLSGGHITGVDIDAEALRRLHQYAAESGVADRVHTVQGSLMKMDFSDASFDIIWAEGSIAVIGFKQGLQAWKRFLKPEGYLVVHDEAGDIDQKVGQIAACGYELVEFFEVGNEVWWEEYYAPLNDVVQQLKKKGAQDPALEAGLERAQREIDGYQVHPERYHSVYFIMRKGASQD
ncbi:MAG: class I SAM-dependent methyltransferase [Candidatus Hermodarchaeota archaeon]